MRRFATLAMVAAGFLGMGAAVPGPATVRPPAVLHVGDVALRPPKGLTLCPALEEDLVTLIIGRSLTACTGEGIPRHGIEDEDLPLPSRIQFHSSSVSTLESPVVAGGGKPFGEVWLFGELTPLEIFRRGHWVTVRLTAYFSMAGDYNGLGQFDAALITTDARLAHDLPVFKSVLNGVADCRGRSNDACAAPQWTGAAKPS